MLEHQVLKFDEKSGYALVYLPTNGAYPFAYVYGYDPKSGEWSQGHYCPDYEQAISGYEIAIGIAEETPKAKCFPVHGVVTRRFGFEVLVKANDVDEAREAFGDFIREHAREAFSASFEIDSMFAFDGCDSPVMIAEDDLDVDGRFKIG